MKKRSGFVSNSSSSSFICDMCGGIESGRDTSPSDFDMLECKAGHMWHEDCVKLDLNDIGCDPDKCDFDEDSYVKESACPFCNLKEIASENIDHYIGVKYQIDRDEIVAEIKAKFKTDRELWTYINENRKIPVNKEVANES